VSTIDGTTTPSKDWSKSHEITTRRGASLNILDESVPEWTASETLRVRWAAGSAFIEPASMTMSLRPQWLCHWGRSSPMMVKISPRTVFILINYCCVILVDQSELWTQTVDRSGLWKVYCSWLWNGVDHSEPWTGEDFRPNWTRVKCGLEWLRQEWTVPYTGVDLSRPWTRMDQNQSAPSTNVDWGGLQWTRVNIVCPRPTCLFSGKPFKFIKVTIDTSSFYPLSCNLTIHLVLSAWGQIDPNI